MVRSGEGIHALVTSLRRNAGQFFVHRSSERCKPVHIYRDTVLPARDNSSQKTTTRFINSNQDAINLDRWTGEPCRAGPSSADRSALRARTRRDRTWRIGGRPHAPPAMPRCPRTVSAPLQGQSGVRAKNVCRTHVTSHESA